MSNLTIKHLGLLALALVASAGGPRAAFADIVIPGAACRPANQNEAPAFDYPLMAIRNTSNAARKVFCPIAHHVQATSVTLEVRFQGGSPADTSCSLIIQGPDGGVSGVVFQDDFETNRGWLVAPGPTGLPQIPANASLGVNCLLTPGQRLDRVNDVDGGVTSVVPSSLRAP